MKIGKTFSTNPIKLYTNDLNDVIGGTVYTWPIYHDEIKTTPTMYCVRFCSEGTYSTRIFKDKKEAYEFDALMNKK